MDMAMGMVAMVLMRQTIKRKIRRKDQRPRMWVSRMANLKTQVKMARAVRLKFRQPQANRQERQITMMERKNQREEHNQKSKKTE